MQTKPDLIVLLAGLLLGLTSAGNSLADSPRSGARYAGQAAHGRVLHVQHHRPVLAHRSHAPRVHSRSHYRAPRHFRGHRQWVRHAGYRYRPARRFVHGHHGYYGHGRRHRHVDAGAVVAGLVLGRLVYELLEGDDRREVYYEEVYYRD